MGEPSRQSVDRTDAPPSPSAPGHYRPPATLEVRPSPGRGLGVFARVALAPGDVIERAPVLVLPLDQAAACPALGPYAFMWSDDEVALTLGYGSLYNHSYAPNADYDDIEGPGKAFVALEAIAPGEEITVNYNGDPDDRGPVGFEVVPDATPPEGR